ncbi:MAG: hypothetical protein AB7O96_11625 [Pseudobdellovibrionaceae bacterium]
MNSLKSESRITVEFHFPEINLALIGVEDVSFANIKTWLESQPGILNVDFEILEDRPGVLK